MGAEFTLLAHIFAVQIANIELRLHRVCPCGQRVWLKKMNIERVFLPATVSPAGNTFPCFVSGRYGPL